MKDDGLTRRVEQKLAAVEAGQLRDTAVSVSGGRTIGFLDLLRAWGSHVEKIKQDLAMPRDASGVWGPHDLLAGSSLRDFIEDGIGMLDSGDVGVVQDVLADIDEEFQAFTESCGPEFNKYIDDSIEWSEGWWWTRIPRSGPLREEIDLIVSRVQGY